MLLVWYQQRKTSQVVNLVFASPPPRLAFLYLILRHFLSMLGDNFLRFKIVLCIDGDCLISRWEFSAWTNPKVINSCILVHPWLIT